MTILATASVPVSNRLEDATTVRLSEVFLSQFRPAALDCPAWCVEDETHRRYPAVQLHQSERREFTALDAGAYDAPATAQVWVETSESDDPDEPDDPTATRLVLTLKAGAEGGYPNEQGVVGWTGTPEQAEALAAELLSAARLMRASQTGTR
jgi:uncharacterized protein DUF6907